MFAGLLFVRRQLADLGRRVRRPHQRLADQHRVDPNASSSSRVSRSAIPLSETTVLPAGTSVISSNVVCTSTEVIEVAVVDPDHLGIDAERALELLLRVDFDDAIEVEAASLVMEAGELVLLECGNDQQDRVRAGAAAS